MSPPTYAPPSPVGVSPAFGGVCPINAQSLYGARGALISLRSRSRSIAPVTRFSASACETRLRPFSRSSRCASDGTLPLYGRLPPASRPLMASLTASSASLSRYSTGLIRRALLLRRLLDVRRDVDE